MKSAVVALMSAILVAVTARAETLPPPRVLDDFESSSPWTAIPASGVEMKLSLEPHGTGHALRVDFEFTKGGGYAVLHRKLDLALPANYRFEFQLRGETAPQNLEFKLLDASGENVWWSNRTDYAFPREWRADRLRKRQISFAWGPKGGGELARAAAIEFAITAGSGGKGTVWFDDLTLVTLPVAGSPPPPVARASSAAPGHAAALAVDSSATTWWLSAYDDKAPSFTLDLGTMREFGGLVLDWVESRHASDYVVEADDGDGKWRMLRTVHGGDGGRDWLDLPESEARRLRVRSLGRPRFGLAIAEAAVEPLEWGATAERFFTAVAHDRPRGHYPRGFLGEQSYWTVVGVDGSPDEGLIDEDARVETGRAQFSLEPFLRTDHGVFTWANGRSVASLAQGSLPIPTCRREADSLALTVTAFARGTRERSELVVRYRVRNLLREPREVTLVLAVRPFQVNPPSQFLNVAGGPARIDSLLRTGARVRVNERELLFGPPPTGFGALTFDEGDLVDRIATGTVPVRDALEDPAGRATGVPRWTFSLPGYTEQEFVARIPFGDAKPDSFAVADAAKWQGEAEDDWQKRLGSFWLEAGGSGAEVARTLRAQLGFVLVNRDGPGIQPGSRSYERSWIRDGSLTSTALLRCGMVEPVREYLTWFAQHQYADGKVPCCVDRRGSDPVPEHDSHGEFVFLVAEYLRLTGDRETVAKLWPNVRSAVAYLDTLRAQRLTPEWRTKANAPYRGILPPSISHEGYSAKPMHSYWDDLFALRGYKDAVWLAEALGQTKDLRALRASRDRFAADFAAAVRAAMKAHGIDFIPGCSDLGDFDPTSTTIALSPVQAGKVLPPDALERTFTRYWEFFQRRADGREKWDAYTPYELRTVGAFVRLGRREQAQDLLRWFMGDRRPEGWRQWAEVVDRDPRHARFIGDMPHTWVGTDFVRSVQEMLAYERESDSTLVLAAGVPEDWLQDGGVHMNGLQTRWGAVSYTVGYHLREDGAHVVLSLDGAALRLPPGGIVFAPPLGAPLPARGAVSVDGELTPVSASDGSFHWPPSRRGYLLPRTIEWGYAVPGPARRAR